MNYAKGERFEVKTTAKQELHRLLDEGCAEAVIRL